MVTSRADPWCSRIVELAARMLPADQRQRYALEFIAELYDMPRAQQFHHAVQVLASAWALRSVLRATPTMNPQEITMPTQPRRRIRCLLRLHQWHWLSTEDGDRYQTCLRCGRDRTDPARGLAAGSAAIG